jgi:hypothetical protein
MISSETQLGNKKPAMPVDMRVVRLLAEIWDDLVERVKGIEPSYEAWEAAVLPLNYTRVEGIVVFSCRNPRQTEAARPGG